MDDEKVKERHEAFLENRLAEIAHQLERSRIADYVHLLNRPGRLITLHFVTGLARGVGITVGFTFITTAILYVLRKIGALNLPIIGDYIADIVRIVQAQLESGAF